MSYVHIQHLAQRVLWEPDLGSVSSSKKKVLWAAGWAPGVLGSFLVAPLIGYTVLARIASCVPVVNVMPAFVGTWRLLHAA